MTFEEFFIKKRIDLTQLQRARPDLYEEFRDHYAQMSERSFDHTKKYWFNRLRKDFLLEVVETPKTPIGGKQAATAEDVEPPAVPTMAAKPPGFKPRFKPNVVKPAADTAVTPQKEEGVGNKPSASNMKPTGFKPRFKPGATATAKKAAELPAAEDSNQSDEQPAAPAVSQAKPSGFKPRFKAAVTSPVEKPAHHNEKTDPEASGPIPEPSQEITSKPVGFKPRFKAGKTTNKKD